MGAAELTGKVLALAFLCSLSFIVRSQDYSAGINTETPSPNAVLHLVAPNGDQGLIVPVLTNAQRSSFDPGGDNGLLVYDSDEDLFYYWLSGTWIPLITPNTFPAVGDVSGSFSTGFTVDEIGGVTSADIATIASTFANAPSLDLDATDDITSVATDGSLTGDGTSGTPLGVAVVDPSLIGPGTATDGQRLQFDGTSSSWVPVTVPGVTAGSITTTEILDGTIQDIDIQDVDWTKILNAPIGTGANQLVQLNASGQLPAVDGSLLTGILSTAASDGVSLTGDGTVGNELAVLSVDPSLIAAGGATLAGQVLEWNGTNWVPGSNISALAAPLFDGTTIIGTGISTDAYRVNVGTLSGQILQFSVDNQLPALDGSLLTGVGDMQSGTYDPGSIAGDVYDFSNHFSTTTATNGDVLTFNGTNWDAAPGASDLASVLTIGNDAGANDIVNTGFIGVENATPPNALQVGLTLGMGHLQNDTEGIDADALLHNIHVDRSTNPDEQLIRTNGNAGSFIVLEDGSLVLIRSTAGSPGSPLDISDLSTEVIPWVEFDNLGNTNITGGINLGDPVGGTEQDGMLRFDGTNFQGYNTAQGGWVNLDDGIALPFSAFLADPGELFNITNTGVGDAAQFSIINSGNGATALRANTDGTGVAASFENTNTLNGSAVLNVSNVGGGPAIQAYTNGTGNAIDAFQDAATSGSAITASINQAGNTSPVIDINNSGTGSGILLSMDPGNTSPALIINHNGDGEGVSVNLNGASTGPGMSINNPGTGPDLVLNGTGVISIPTGTAGHVLTSNGSGDVSLQPPLILPYINNLNNPANLFEIYQDGTGPGGAAYFGATSGTFGANVVTVEANAAAGSKLLDVVSNAGLGAGVDINLGAAGNTSTALRSRTFGTGNAAEFVHDGTSGSALRVENTNGTNSNPTLQVLNSGDGAGIDVSVVGTENALNAITGGSGNAGFFQKTDPTSGTEALSVLTLGIGSAASFSISNTGSSAPALSSVTDGTGPAGQFNKTGTDTSPVIEVLNSGAGPDIQLTGGAAIPFNIPGGAIGEVLTSDASGNVTLQTAPGLTLPFTQTLANTGDLFTLENTDGTSGGVANFQINNAANSGTALLAATNGTGVAFQAANNGTGNVADLSINNPGGGGNVINASTIGSGGAGVFQIFNGSSTATALSASTDGAGSALQGGNSGTGFAGQFRQSNNTASGAPAVIVEISGATNPSPVIRVLNSGAGPDIQLPTGATAGYVLTADDGLGNASWQASNSITVDHFQNPENLVFGSTTPSATLPPNDFQLGAVAPNGQVNLSGTSHGMQTQLTLLRANGSQGAETSIIASDVIGEVAFIGHDGGGYFRQGMIRGVATENWVSASNRGSALTFHTTQTGTTSQSEVMRIQDSEVRITGIPRIDNPAGGLGGRIALEDDGGANALEISAHPSSSAYIVVYPQSQGTGALTNDGAGNLSWTNSGAFTSDGNNNLIAVSTAVPAGSGNFVAGLNAGQNLTTGSFNTLIGQGAGMLLDDDDNNFIAGLNAGDALVSGGSNILIGLSAAADLATGGSNIVLGDNAGGGAFTAGPGNVIIGQSATTSEITTPHVIIGQGARSNGVVGVAVGVGAFADGDNSVALGQGSNVGGATTGSIALGSGASATGNNAMAIGYLTTAPQDNSAIIGDPGSPLDVGIGTNTPTARLDVVKLTGETGIALRVEHQDDGNVAYFDQTNTGSGADAMFVQTVGIGAAASFQINNIGNSAPVVTANTNGTGRGGQFVINNGTNAQAALFASTNGTGAALFGSSTGAGNGLAVDHQGTSGNAVSINHVGATGLGVAINMNGTGDEGLFIGGTAPGVNSVDVDGGISVGGDATLDGNLITPSVASTLAVTPTNRVMTLNTGGVVSIQNGVDGQELILVCIGGVPSIPDGGNIRLDTNLGSPFNMTVGSTIHFVFIAAGIDQWMEIARSQ